MKVSANQDRCCSSGLCVMTAPAVFDQREEDGVVVVLAVSPPPADHALVREAMVACPTGAISVEDDGT